MYSRRVELAVQELRGKYFLCMCRSGDRNRLRNLLTTNSPSSEAEHCHGIPHLETLLVVMKLTSVEARSVIGYLSPNCSERGYRVDRFSCTKIKSACYWFMSFYDKRNFGRAFRYFCHLLVVSTRAIACTVVLGEWGGEIIIIIRRLKLSRDFHIISISSVLLKMQAAFRAKIVVLGKLNAIS